MSVGELISPSEKTTRPMVKASAYEGPNRSKGNKIRLRLAAFELNMLESTRFEVARILFETKEKDTT